MHHPFFALGRVGSLANSLTTNIYQQKTHQSSSYYLFGILDLGLNHSKQTLVFHSFLIFNGLGILSNGTWFTETCKMVLRRSKTLALNDFSTAVGAVDFLGFSICSVVDGGMGMWGYNHYEKSTPPKKDPYKNCDLICIVLAEQPLALRMK